MRTALLLALLLVACGSRTGIDLGEGTGGSSSGGGGSSGGSGSSGSSGSSGGMPMGIYCDEAMGGIQVCVGYSGLTPGQGAQLTSACQQAGGSIVTSCPASGQVGCCTIMQGGYTVEACYYCPLDPAMAQQACTGSMIGTWTPSGAACGG